MAQLLTVRQVAGQPGVSRSTVDKILEDRVFPGRTDPASRRRPALGAGGRR